MIDIIMKENMIEIKLEVESLSINKLNNLSEVIEKPLLNILIELDEYPVMYISNSKDSLIKNNRFKMILEDEFIDHMVAIRNQEVSNPLYDYKGGLFDINSIGDGKKIYLEFTNYSDLCSYNITIKTSDFFELFYNVNKYNFLLKKHLEYIRKRF